ncbi:MAG: cyclase, partial [Planctomycetota bacterium]
RGGNIGFSNGPDGMLVIDSQFDWLAPKIEAALLKLQADGPSFLVNTHVHGDHTGGNAVLGKYGSIVAHTNTRGRLISEAGEQSDAVNDKLPTITFDESMSLHFNGEEVKLIHMAGSHTDTDVAVWFTGSKVLHTGDLFFAGAFPFVDVGRGGNVDRLIGSVEALLAMIPDDAKIIPGHGQVCGPAEFRVYLEMLIECRGRVAEALEAGKSLEEMVAMELLGDYAPEWGAGFIGAEQFLGAIVASISAN